MQYYNMRQTAQRRQDAAALVHASSSATTSSTTAADASAAAAASAARGEGSYQLNKEAMALSVPGMNETNDHFMGLMYYKVSSMWLHMVEADYNSVGWCHK